MKNNTTRRDFISKLGLAGGAFAASALASATAAEESPKPATKPRVLLVNGSPNEKGCTYTALSLVAEELNKAGVETEIMYLGSGPFDDCTDCRQCRADGLGKCVLEDDCANEIIEKAKSCHGFVFGSPVYFGHPSGRIMCIMNRAFFAGYSIFAQKPAAAVASSRRAGSLATLDAIQKHFTIAGMPVISSTYWAEVHGHKPADVLNDIEGVDVMHQLGRNMAMAVKNYMANPPEPMHPKRTMNFIRDDA